MKLEAIRKVVGGFVLRVLSMNWECLGQFLWSMATMMLI